MFILVWSHVFADTEHIGPFGTIDLARRYAERYNMTDWQVIRVIPLSPDDVEEFGVFSPCEDERND